ncbi:hypothetical protein D3C72_2009090 [compost metagenome]
MADMISEAFISPERHFFQATFADSEVVIADAIRPLYFSTEASTSCWKAAVTLGAFESAGSKVS